MNQSYEAVNFLTAWIGYIKLIVPIAAGAVIAYQAFRKATTEDDSIIGDCNIKIRNTIIGSIIIMSLSGLIDLFKGYYQ